MTDCPALLLQDCVCVYVFPSFLVVVFPLCEEREERKKAFEAIIQGATTLPKTGRSKQREGMFVFLFDFVFDFCIMPLLNPNLGFKRKNNIGETVNTQR